MCLLTISLSTHTVMLLIEPPTSGGRSGPLALGRHSSLNVLIQTSSCIYWRQYLQYQESHNHNRNARLARRSPITNRIWIYINAGKQRSNDRWAGKNGSSGRVNLVYVATIKTRNIHELYILHTWYIYIYNTLRLLYTIYESCYICYIIIIYYNILKHG